MLKFGACDRSGLATPQPFARMRTLVDPQFVRQSFQQRTVPSIPGAAGFQIQGTEIRVSNPFFEGQYNRVPLEGYWFFELFCEDAQSDETGAIRQMPPFSVRVDVVEFGQTESVHTVINTTSLAAGLVNFTDGFRVVDAVTDFSSLNGITEGRILFNDPVAGQISAGISVSGGQLVVATGQYAARRLTDSGCMIQWVAEIPDIEDRQFQMTTTTSDEWQHLPSAEFVAVKLGLCVPQ